MTLCEKKENNDSIEERLNENNNVRNEDISVKFNNYDVNNKNYNSFLYNIIFL